MSVRDAGNAVGRARVWTALAAVVASGIASSAIAPSVAHGEEASWPPPEGTACKPTPKAVEEAKTLFRLGSDAFATSNYTDAIKYWRDAYVRDCTAHVLLKNLGKAYEADGQYGAAVDAYRLYRIRAKITGDELDLIDAKISNLSKRVSATTSATATASPTTTSTSAATTTTTAATTAPTAATSTAPTTTASTSASTDAPPPPRAPSSGEGPGTLPWVLTVGGGAIFLGGGGVWLWKNSSISSDTTTFNSLNCGTAPKRADVSQCNALQSSVSSASTPRTIGVVGAVAGLGVGAVGLVLLLTSGSTSDAAPAKPGVSFVTPTFAPGFTGLSIGGAF